MINNNIYYEYFMEVLCFLLSGNWSTNNEEVGDEGVEMLHSDNNAGPALLTTTPMKAPHTSHRSCTLLHYACVRHSSDNRNGCVCPSSNLD